jgi:ABC-2 type transport system ATP-binding protein
MITVSVNHLGKSYGEVKAIDGISFDVDQSEIFGLIGPDGAGKTSIFRILATLILADEGNARLLNFDVVKDYKKIRQCIGYMPGRFSLYQDLTVEENLSFFASVFGTSIRENYDLVKDIYQQIEPFKKRRAGALSGGMKQKLALSCALIHKPEILILDEPTTGVDAVSRKEFWEMLRKLKNSGITILVSTPYMDEASLCDRVALIQKGKIMQINSPGNIVKQYQRPLFAIRSGNMYNLLNCLRQFENTYSAFAFGQYVHFTAKTGEIDINELTKYLSSHHFVDIEIKRINPNIEDCFMALMV